MNRRKRLIAAAIISMALCAVAASAGTRAISFADTIKVILQHILPGEFDFTKKISSAKAAIVWDLRLPRVIFAFLSGGALALSGAVIQSMLLNPLASPYILGVSSGASLGAALVMLGGISLSFAASFTLPFAGFLFALITVMAVAAFSSKLDKNMSNNTIILFGMVVSLFINAVLTTLVALFHEELRSLIFWQMGSFAGRSWLHLLHLAPFLIIGVLGLSRWTVELDLLAFGDEHARTAGVETKTARRALLLFSTLLTGSVVALSGTIGFVDLIAPHAARRIIGPEHRAALPMSFLIGGALCVAADLAARTLVSPSELPVGAITALIGAPFFVWVYFRRRG